MDIDGHIKISDIGLSKILEVTDDKAYTLCETPQYIAPEILKNKGYDKTVDWWALGCILYEMITGCLPFLIPRGNKINPKVYEEPLRFPQDINPLAVNLINQLLTVNPIKRLGYGENDAQKIKDHPYFKGINWEKYWNKETEPPFIPELNSEIDLKYFDKMFTDEPVNSNRPTVMSRTRIQGVYKGFTFVNQSVCNELIKFNGNDDEDITEYIAEQNI